MPKAAAQAPAPKAAPVIPVQTVTPAPLVPLQVKVGMLLPLSGPNASLGNAMLNAAQQAVFDAAATNFELMPRDTGANEYAAGAAAHDAISSGAQLLIGPLFAPQIPAVRHVAEQAGIPALALSTDTSLAAPGLYVMGFAPGAQAERIARFAAARGMRRFAALVPNTTYGALVGQAFQLAVAEAGGTVISLNTYDATKHDSEAQIKSLADQSGVIDALFLPEGGADLTLITQQLAAAGFDPQKIRMLGTGLWDAPDTGHQNPFVVGGWYAAPDATTRQNFIAAYKATYGEEPPRLATLAYDATALAAIMAKRGARYDQASLTNSNGFAGLDGIFRLKFNGEVERGLAILEVTPDGQRAIDAAPTSFAAPPY